MNLLVLAAALCLTGCMVLPQPPVSQAAQTSYANIAVSFIPAAEVHDACAKAVPLPEGGKVFVYFKACAIINETKDGAAVCNIIMPEPASFNDTENLTVLGHEAWHCFGAKH